MITKTELTLSGTARQRNKLCEKEKQGMIIVTENSVINQMIFFPVQLGVLHCIRY